ncbi:MAG: hypothetical protein ACTSQ1_11530 [Promethearchaeota archaeon]
MVGVAIRFSERSSINWFVSSRGSSGSNNTVQIFLNYISYDFLLSTFSSEERMSFRYYYII